MTSVGVCLFLGAAGLGAGAEDPKAFQIVSDEYGTVVKTPDGRTVFRYMIKKPANSPLTANSVCCLFPVNTPSGERAVDFAPSDHLHHRGVFLAWHAMEGKKPADFWGWGQFAPTKDRVIVNRSVKPTKADARGAELAVVNQWLAEGVVLIDESTRIVARERKPAFVIDLDFRLTPTSNLTLKQTAFSGFCVKARKEGKAFYRDPMGVVSLPDPHYLKPETDWPAADYYDYVIDLDSGRTIGVAVIDHPGNPPSKWHNLKPIAMINPCFVAPGPVTLKGGQPLRLRYRLVVHDGTTPNRLLKQLAAEWRGR
jgi:hypothetical protein